MFFKSSPGDFSLQSELMTSVLQDEVPTLRSPHAPPILLLES